MNGDPQKRKVLYEALTKDGYDLGTYEEYSAKLDDPAKVRALYDGIKGKYDVGDFEVFSAKVGPSFQQPLKSMTTPAGAASGGSMLSATGSAGSVAAPSPSPEPQGPPSPQGYTFTEDYLTEVAPPPAVSQPKEFTLVSGFKPVEQAVKEANLFNAIEGEKTRGRIAPLMFASPEGQQALKKISANAETSMAATFAGTQSEPEPSVFLRFQGFQFPSDPNPVIGKLASDPREEKIFYDFETLAPKIGQRLTQFTEQERRERKEVNAWRPRDEFDYRAGAYEFQSRLLHGDLLRISDAIKEGADPAAYAEKLQDIQAGLNYIGQKYRELAVWDTPSFREKMLELQQQLSNANPDSGIRQGGRSFVYGGTKAMASTLAGAARLLDFGDGYTTADKLSDWAADMAQVRDVQQSEEFKESAFGKVLDGAGAMAIYIMGAAPGGIAAEAGAAMNAPKLAAAAGTIGTASAAGTMYAAEYEGFVRQAMEQGAPKEVAESGANIYAPLATAIEFFNPQLYLAGRKAAMEPVKKQFMSLIKEGMAPHTAMKTAMELADAGTREAIEELGQTLTERGVNMASNALAGTELNTDISSKEAAETALVSFILGGAASGVNLAATRKERQAQRTKANAEAMHWAMQNPKEAEELIAKVDIPEEQKVKAIEKVQRMASIFRGNNLKEKDPEVATNIVEAVAEKKDIEQDIKENPVDPAIEAAVGDPRKREVAEITKEIMSLMEIPQDRARAALAGTGMERVEEKVVKQPDGSVVLESKEAPKTQPKDEVDAILDEEFAAEPEAAVPGGLPEVPTGTSEATTAIETPQGTGVEVEVGPVGAVTPEATSAVILTAPEVVTTEPAAPVAQKPKRGKKAAAQATPAAPAPEPVTSITEVVKNKDGSQIEYKVPGWEDLRIVVQREKGGYAANIMVGDQALKIQPKGKEEGTAKLAILDAKERLDRAGREKISALISSATPSAQRPQDGITPSETAIDRIDNVVKALRSIVPDLAVIVHDTPEEFAADSRRAGGRGLASDAAFYDPKTNAIHLNRQMASDNTLFHEAAHPILLSVLQNNPELFLSLYKQLATDPAFAKYIEFGESYSDKDELTRAAESLAEFMADVAAGKVQFSKEPGSLWQKFVEWLQELMAKVGLDFRAIDLSNPKNVRDFASKFARGVREGIELKGLAEVRRSDALPMLQEDAQAVVDGWYSRLDQAVAAKGSTMPGSQWGKWLEARAKEGALSLEEAKWTGLNDFLASKGNEKVTPQQVREFLKENRVKVEVKELGGSKPPLEWKRYDLGAAGFYAEANGFRITPGGMGKVDLQGPNSYIGRYDGEDEAMEAAEDVHQGSKEYGVTPKFSQYQLPGGSRYREVLVMLPTHRNIPVKGWAWREIENPAYSDGRRMFTLHSTAKEKNEQAIGAFIYDNADGSFTVTDEPGENDVTFSSLDEARQEAEKRAKEGAQYAVVENQRFVSSHFDEPNILVHLRLNDRTGPSGEKILFIEELQSDFGQSLRKLEATIDQNFDDIVEKMKADGVLKKRCP